MEGTITWFSGKVTYFRTDEDDNGLDAIWYYIPEWGKWSRAGAEYHTAEDVIRHLELGIGFISGGAPQISCYLDGCGPSLPVVPRQSVPYYFSKPDNPDVAGEVESVTVVDGREVAHIREAVSEQCARE